MPVAYMGRKYGRICLHGAGSIVECACGIHGEGDRKRWQGRKMKEASLRNLEDGSYIY